MKLLFANIGWMTHYQGNNTKDQIVGGGSYRNDDKHEAYNFFPIDGKCFGYVQPVRGGIISLNRIDKNCANKDVLKGVLVVWIATHPNVGGTYIVGWYKNATVFSSFQDSNDISRKKYDYNMIANEQDCTLLPIDKRIFLVPRANVKGKGFLGQSNIWYADSTNLLVKKFRKEVIDYINHYSDKSKKVHVSSLRVDAEARKKVEEAAVAYVTKEYQSLGYTVTSREKENVGWDLDAEINGNKLKLEVKGLAQSQVSVRISNNEYKSMVSNKECYRLCVVVNAIISPTLITFIWNNEKESWVSDEDESVRLSIELKPSYLAEIK